jgi:hypothetical protein
MELGLVVVVIVAAWLALFVVVLAMCKTASHADDRLYSVDERATPRHHRWRPHFHGLHLHRG